MTGDSVTSREARQQLYDIVRQDIPFKQKGREALALGAEYLQADNGHLTRIDQETDHWEATVSTDPDSGAFPTGLELDLGATYCRRTLDSDSQIALHDASNQGWETDIAFESHGLNCYLGTTLVVDGESYGTVCFVADEPRQESFSNEETMFAELIARLLERELEREQHEATLTQYANLALVLNRVLRHNLRNDMCIIRGYTQLMAERLDHDSYGDTVLKNIDNLIELTEKARELDEIVAADHERETANVVSLVEDVVNGVCQDYPNAAVSIESESEITVGLLPSCERALRELLENAAKHSGTHPQITVAIETVPNAVEIHIGDNGPGLDDEEAEVLETGAETPLTHGSGLGLWLTHWIISNHDGEITALFSEAGTTMTVSIPRRAATNPQERLAKLTRARDQYEATFEESLDAMLLVNDDARVVDANPAAEHVYGVNQRALLGRHLSEFIPVEVDFDTAWREFQQSGVDRDRIPIDGGDGVTRQIEYSAVTDIVPGEHLIISHDVTDRVQRKKEFREMTERLETIIDISPALIIALDADGRIELWNKTAETVFGCDAESVVGDQIQDLRLHTDAQETEFETQFKRVLGGATLKNYEIRRNTKDDSRIRLSLSAAPIRDRSGVITGAIAVAKDITEYV
ncbi:PAS domain S-box protein [Halorubrum sp. DTA46]|uniref:PAS domain S-box protein n=1 Tax=Halorubrum sp. DTA46 TaxID=3402162 RepID=UPI003AAADC9A